MRAKCGWLMVVLAIVMVAGGAWAFQPAGWLFFQWPYAYSMNGSAWYYFNLPCTQYRVSLPGGVWQFLSQGGTATGWNYYQWPYCFSMTADGWFYMDTNSVQWCVNLNDSRWSKFGQVDAPPSGMVLIPAGSFVMGNATNVFPDSEGIFDEEPQHTVYVSAFYMGRYEVTKGEWDEVYAWAITNGYGFDNAGSGKAANHPVQRVTWYDVVKWCNARSQKEGWTPCYTVGGSVYKAGESAPDCNWAAAGYRLPTEAEWEKAARGGVANTRFPWSDVNTIDHSRANYWSHWSGGMPYYTYDLGYHGYDTNYNDDVSPYTSPVGAFAPNGYGLYDMAGNVWEWCWDSFDEDYYATSPGTDPRGPVTSSGRVIRGGWLYDIGYNCRVALRDGDRPDYAYGYYGFRVILSAGQ